MKAIQCSHSEEEPKWQICDHLLARVGKSYDSANLSHYRQFTKKGSEYVLLCAECASAPKQAESDLRWVCADCFGEVAQGGRRLGVQGSPEIRERDAGLRLNQQNIVLPESPGKLLTVTAASTSAGQCWLALNDRRELIAFDPEGGAIRRRFLLDDLRVPHDHPLTLVAPPKGDLVAIASTYGTHGIVLDLQSGKATMQLNRGLYYVEHCRFPVAFFELNGRNLLVHATDWNRLDVSEPSTGNLLTSRQPTSYRRGDAQPEHYLDYFHCGLTVSPDSEWIAGNGWVWHPVGAIDTWSLNCWLETNVWESEDGESKRRLCWRDYYWDGPLCWVDRRTLAVWGHGDDDVLMVPGIRLFDVETGKELPGFSGPLVGGSSLDQITSNGKASNISHTSGTILFDEFLFSYDRGCEFAVWDVATGERLLHTNDFLPLSYDYTTKTFLSQKADGSIQLTKLVKSEK